MAARRREEKRGPFGLCSFPGYEKLREKFSRWPRLIGVLWAATLARPRVVPRAALAKCSRSNRFAAACKFRCGIQRFRGKHGIIASALRAWGLRPGSDAPSPVSGFRCALGGLALVPLDLHGLGKLRQFGIVHLRYIDVQHPDPLTPKALRAFGIDWRTVQVLIALAK